VLDRPLPRALARLLSMLAVLALTRPLQAQEAMRQRVYIVANAIEPELEAVAQRAAAAARAALRGIPEASWEEADRRFLGYDQATLDTLEMARQQLDEGRAAYLELQLDNAIASLESAVAGFDQAAAALEDPSDLASALLYLGASQVFNGQTRDARTTFERLHAQMPHVVPDPNEFPPDVVNRYEQAAPRRSDATLTIESDPPGAVAYVDFVPRGVTPVTIDSLARGDHIVRVTRPGATPYIETVTLGRETANVGAFLMDAEGNEGLADTVSAITGQELQTGDGPVQEVGQMLELDKIGVIRVSYGDSSDSVKLEMVMFDVATGRRLLRGEVQAPRALGELETAVQSAVGASLERVLAPAANGGVGEDDEQIPAVIVDDDDDDEDDDDGEAGIVGQWWFWTAIGGVVLVGAAIAIGVAVSGGSDLGGNQNGQVVLEFN